MNKQLTFTYNDVDYTLEYTRRTVEMMERNGFLISNVKDKPMSTLPPLFSGAFLAHHRYVKPNVVDEIYASLENKSELLGKLVEMYNEPIAALIDDPEGENQGKVQWSANW